MASHGRRRAFAEVDYLVRSIDTPRPGRSPERFRQPWRSPPRPSEAGSAAADGSGADLEEVAGFAPRVLVGEREHRLYVLQWEKIDYIESHGNYVKFHVGNVDYISRDSLKRLCRVLTGSGFVRIERSLLINIRAISYAQREGRGVYALTLLSGSRLRSSATYRNEMLRVLPLTRTPRQRPRAHL